MKQIITFIFLVVGCLSYGQGICTDCGPAGLENNRTNIVSGNEKLSPYNGIFHLRVTRGFIRTNLSTGTFIANDLIITANHNLMYSPFITKVEFFLNGNWIKISNYKIYHYHQSFLHKRNKDIAILKIFNLEKLKNISHTNFIPCDYSKIESTAGINFNLTGFPCDRPDTLVEKTTWSDNLLSDQTNTVFSYKKLYTCTGDSGAPLWFEKEGRNFIVSIHHGGNDFGAFDDNNTNVAIKITPDIITWINTKTHSKF
ncbi:serine protease [Flavobacterium sp. SLB02]|uniref:trypsin-like serine peptidase n=1 Tax=Flavobacterium sp. SLB02 TaxID=2665645 RepID=UPI0012A9F041|nr:trypsin-like serine protease [Flavobacterium sp. SLB02]QGK73186.1 trypsin-like serine protease [Flavobacterium sp. SLB02]